MVEITEEDLKDARFYHEVYMLLVSYSEWKKLPNQNFETKSIWTALNIIKGILSTKE